MNLPGIIVVTILCAGVLCITAACVVLSIEACAIARLFKKP